MDLKDNSENIYEKIEIAKELIDKLDKNYLKVDGGVKTKRYIEKEIKFLQKVRR